VKVACTVWSGGKASDYFKGLPIAITVTLDKKKNTLLISSGTTKNGIEENWKIDRKQGQ